MKVSIIIPVYNVEPYIERCIKSVMKQTYQDIECILVNDASPDDSITIAERLIADYNGPIQFRILNHEHNRGVSAARNTGIDAATGDYLYFFDSDDEITLDCIEKLSRPVLSDASIEMVEGCYAVCYKDCNNGKPDCPMSKQQKELISHKAVRDFYFSKQARNIFATNKLTKRDFVLKNQLYFKEGISLGEDYIWHFFYFKYLSHLYIISDITYTYYKRPCSATTAPNQDIRAGIGLRYAEIAKNLSPTEGSQEVKYFLKGFCLLYINGPTTPIYKQVAIQFLKVLKDNHCFKECFFLKTIVFVSKFSIIKNFIKKLGVFLKSISKNKDENNFKM